MKIVLLTKHYKADSTDWAYKVGAFLEERGHEVKLKYHKIEAAQELVGTDLAVSYFYPHILPPEVFNTPRYKTLNCHPGLLPHGRGAMPNVWSIVDRTPPGATIHWMDSGIDTGPILKQVKVEPLQTDTGETLYLRLEQTCYQLFLDFWPDFEAKLLAGTVPFGEQQSDLDSAPQRTSEVGRIDNLDRQFGPTARQIIDILRARTFSGHEAAYVYDPTTGRKIYARVSLEEKK